MEAAAKERAAAVACQAADAARGEILSRFRKVAVDFQFEAVLGKTRRTEF